MKLYLVIAFVALTQLAISCVDARGGRGGGGRGGGRGGSRGGSRGGGSSSHSSGTHSSSGSSYHPASSSNHYSSGGSNPHTIGWNPPSNNYHPSGGYGHNTGGAFGQQSYNPYKPSAPHLQPASGSFNYNPSYNPGYSHTPVAHYNPPVGTYAQPQTIFVQSGQSSGPGWGQLAKEAAVHSVVDTAVKASVNRILPGGISGYHFGSHSSGSASAAANNAAPSHTQITYNNYYGNSAPAGVNQTDQSASNLNGTGSSTTVGTVGDVTTSKAVEEELKFTSPLGRETFKHEIEELSEKLLTNDVNNAYKDKYITIKLQGLKIDDSVEDDAPDNLLKVEDQSVDLLIKDHIFDLSNVLETLNNLVARIDSPNFGEKQAWNIPTIKALLPLHENYILDASKNETVTEEHRDEESKFIDAITNTTVMNMTMNFLVEKGFITNDTYEFKNALKGIWFTRFQRVENVSGSSGFEYAFLAEKINNGIIGLHNWIYYAKREVDKQLNYLGYIGHISLENNGAFVKVRSRLDDTASNVTTLFIGLSPELEMSLYTLCFYISPGYPCPIKLDGHEFRIFITRHRYFDKDVLVSADTDLYIPPPPPTTTTTSTTTSTEPPTSSSLPPLPWYYFTNEKPIHGSASQIHSTMFQLKILFPLLFILSKLF